jgi:hypothetical protein
MRSAREAASFYKNKARNYVGKCLWEVQNAYQSPHMYYDAISQWRNAKKKHPGDRTPPVGAPVYYAGGNHGHVAIYVGGGLVRSSDAGGAGRMGTVTHNWFANNWGYSYLGWTGDIGDKDITYGPKMIEVYVSKLHPGVDNSDSVRMLRLALIRRGFLKVQRPLSEDRPGNKYTSAVAEAVKKWQKKKGHKQTGILTNTQAKQFFAPNKRVKVVPKK